MTSVKTGSGDTRVPDSTVARESVDAVGEDDGSGAAVTSGDGDAAGAGLEAGAGAGAGDGDEVTVGAGAGLARAGESGTAESEARVTTNAARSAVVFRIEFTWCLS